ncbi:MAG: hypothetical protein WC614_00650 [bacterium]
MKKQTEENFWVQATQLSWVSWRDIPAQDKPRVNSGNKKASEKQMKILQWVGNSPEAERSYIAHSEEKKSANLDNMV